MHKSEPKCIYVDGGVKCPGNEEFWKTEKMSSLAGVHYEEQVPLDLRIRKDRPENDLFSSKGSPIRTFPSGGGLIKETGDLLRMHDSFLKIVKQEKQSHFDCNGESFEYNYTSKKGLYLPPKGLAQQEHGMHDTFFNFIKQEKGRFDYTGKTVHLPYPAGNVHLVYMENSSAIFDMENSSATLKQREFYPNKAGTLNVTVKQEPETDEPYFKPDEEKFSFADDFLTKVGENSSDEDNLIIDLNIQETGHGKKRLDRSNSNCSTNSNSSCNSETADDVRAFLRSYSSPLKDHQCSKCKVRCDDLLSLFVHLGEHASQNPGEKFMKCPLCMRKFQKIHGINAHIRKMHLGPLEHTCRFCHTPFKFNLHLQKHESHCKKRKKRESSDDNFAN